MHSICQCTRFEWAQNSFHSVSHDSTLNHSWHRRTIEWNKTQKHFFFSNRIISTHCIRIKNWKKQITEQEIRKRSIPSNFKTVLLGEYIHSAHVSVIKSLVVYINRYRFIGTRCANATESINYFVSGILSSFQSKADIFIPSFVLFFVFLLLIL